MLEKALTLHWLKLKVLTDEGISIAFEFTRVKSSPFLSFALLSANQLKLRTFIKYIENGARATK